MENVVKFFTGTIAQFKALTTKDANAFYLITDLNVIYKGDSLFSTSLKNVATLPAALAQYELGVIYVADDGKVAYSTGTKIVYLNNGQSAIAISKGGVVVEAATTNINFVTPILSVVQDIENPGTVKIDSNLNTAVMCASPYNRNTPGTTDATVPDISGTNNIVSRYVALPSANEYSVGDWNSVAARSVLNTKVANLSYTTSAEFNIPSTTTMMRVRVLQNGAEVFTKSLGPLTDDNLYGSLATDKCTCRITGWGPDLVGYKAKATVVIDYKNIIPTGGRFSIEIAHVDGGTVYEKTQADFFYDANPAAGTVGSVVLSEKTINSKWMSGVQHIGPTSTFDIQVNNLTGFFNSTFVMGCLSTSAIALGISAATTNASDLTTLASIKNTTTVATYTSANRAVGANKFIPVSATVTATANSINGWNTGSVVTSSPLTLSYPLDTYSANSTKLVENFQDENYRLKSDLSTSWNSQDALSAGELMQSEGTNLMRNPGDSTSEQVYYRNFCGTQSSPGGTFTFTGTGLSEANFKTNDYFDIQISLDGNTWYSIKYQNTENDAGIRVQVASANLDKSPKTIQFEFAPGITTGVNTGAGGLVTSNSFGIFCKVVIKNAAVKIDSISLMFR